ncbi:hypothetical protein [Chryseobacterium wanjuense]
MEKLLKPYMSTFTSADFLAVILVFHFLILEISERIIDFIIGIASINFFQKNTGIIDFFLFPDSFKKF